MLNPFLSAPRSCVGQSYISNMTGSKLLISFPSSITQSIRCGAQYFTVQPPEGGGGGCTTPFSKPSPPPTSHQSGEGLGHYNGFNMPQKAHTVSSRKLCGMMSLTHGKPRAHELTNCEPWNHTLPEFRHAFLFVACSSHPLLFIFRMVFISGCINSTEVTFRWQHGATNVILFSKYGFHFFHFPALNALKNVWHKHFSFRGNSIGKLDATMWHVVERITHMHIVHTMKQLHTRLFFLHRSYFLPMRPFFPCQHMVALPTMPL